MQERTCFMDCSLELPSLPVLSPQVRIRLRRVLCFQVRGVPLDLPAHPHGHVPEQHHFRQRAAVQREVAASRGAAFDRVQPVLFVSALDAPRNGSGRLNSCIFASGIRRGLEASETRILPFSPTNSDPLGGSLRSDSSSSGRGGCLCPSYHFTVTGGRSLPSCGPPLPLRAGNS